MIAWRAIGLVPALPWVALTLIAATGTGWWHGRAAGMAVCELARAEASAQLAERMVRDSQRALDTSMRMVEIGRDLRVDLALIREHTTEFVTEITRDVDAHPELISCSVPADTQRLRDAQVADSAALAAGGGPVRRGSADAVPAADRR